MYTERKSYLNEKKVLVLQLIFFITILCVLNFLFLSFPSNLFLNLYSFILVFLVILISYANRKIVEIENSEYIFPVQVKNKFNKNIYLEDMRLYV